MNRQEACSLLNVSLNRISQNKLITPDVYAILITMFPTVISPALEILDHGKVTKVQCQESKRFFYRVREPNTNKASIQQQQTQKDEQNNTWDVKGEMCFCFFYAKECLSENGSALFCKHVLASKIGEALGQVSLKEIEDKDFSPLLLASRAHMNKQYEDRRVSNI